MLSERNTLVVVVLLLLLIVVSLFIYKSSEKDFIAGIPFDEISEDLLFIQHAKDEKIAQETGGVVMRHYGTAEAIRNGGPIYGVLGYGVVSIEYEISADEIGEQPIGDPDQPGYSMLIEQLAFKNKITYDHFHIGVAHRRSHAEDASAKEDFGTNVYDHEHPEEEPVYLIHLMFIPHEMEVSMGLTCS